MATGLRLPLDVTRLVAIVLFLIVGGLFFRTFFHNYVSEPARAADKLAPHLATLRSEGWPPGASITPGAPVSERMRRTYQYATTGDEQAKQWLIQDTKRDSRATHWVAIWGSFIMVCGSIIAAVIAGLPMLLERRA